MRNFARNAMIAALYAVTAWFLPATAFANLRLSTALYVLAAWNPALIPGLAIGNLLAGIPQGPLDMLMGGAVGLLTAWTASRLGPKWAPLAVLLIPTVVVPLWLGWLYHVPYIATVPALAEGQTASAALGWALLRVPQLRRMVEDRG